MRLLTYHTADGTTRAGFVRGETVVDLDRALRATGLAGLGESCTLRSFLQQHGPDLADISGRLLLADAGMVDTVAGIKLAPPIDDPAKVLCVGLNYNDHVAETGRALPSHPDIFSKFASSLIGHGEDMAVASLSPNLDFEGELAIVIGSPMRSVAEDDALAGVAGVTVMNDTTARDLQYRGTQWLLGKAIDRSTPVGPWLVTLDEIDDIQDLTLVTRVNGLEVQRASTSSMIFSVARVISEVSRTIGLSPGDIIATGTPQGIGAKRTPPLWLHPGDTVEIEIDGIGLLRNRVAV